MVLAILCPKADVMSRVIYILLVVMLSCRGIYAQERGLVHGDTLSLMPPADSVPNRIPDFLPADIFIPPVRLVGLDPWTSAPLPRPVVEVMKIYGFNSSIGFGAGGETGD